MLSFKTRARVLAALAFALSAVLAYVPANAGMVLPPRRVAIDASGNGYSGAKLYVYEQGTTTPASIYSDAGLTTPLANPVVANSAGVFAPIYAAEGEIFDLVLKTSGGTTLYTEDDVPAVGADTGAFSRDFTNSRFKISGSGGVVSLEAGPATGDDTGGDIRLGGWSATQADTAEIDAAATTVTGSMDITGAVTTDSTLATGGLITEAGKDLAGVVQTDATTFSGVSALEISLPASPAGVTGWDVYVWDLIQSATSTLDATFSFDNGSTYKTGASDYAFASSASNSTGILNARDDANASIRVLPSSETATTRKGVLRMGVQTASNGDPSMIFGDWFGQHLNGGVNYGGWATFSGTYVGGSVSSPLTRVKLAPSSGTISGKYMIVPKRGTGN